MFKKKKCKKCGERINSSYKFCPNCGNLINSKDGDWGMLGRDDFMSSNEIKIPMGLDRIFNSLIKNLNSQFESDREGRTKKPKIQKKSGISISISTSKDMPPEIKINSFGNNLKPKQKEQQVKEMPLRDLSQRSLKKISSLPKKEPSTNIRRFSDKIVYEIEMPGVKSIDDISIIKLENSIEIKALAKNKAYFKLIPINLPITNYNLSKGKLVLELGVSK